jgi:Ca2+-binding RTX toxin-like protein
MAVYTGLPGVENEFDASLDGAGATMTGAELDDLLIGSNQESTTDTITGLAGEDAIYGGLGALFAYGGDGNDIVEMDPQTDKKGEIYGGGGDDEILTGHGDDLVRGGAGNDKIGDRPSQFVDGLVSDDTFFGEDGDDDLDGSLGEDELYGGNGKDLLNGNEQNDVVEGGAGDDVIGGDEGNDTLSGGGGKDIIQGYLGDDLIRGGTGADSLSGDVSNPFLPPGTGKDVFDFNSAAEAKGDKIVDFRKGYDRIDLKDIDAKSGGGNQKFKFIGTKKFSKTKGELRFEEKSGSTYVSGDVNGDKKADFTIFVANPQDFQKGDFFL